MRVRLTFQVKNRGGVVPFHHQFLIAEIFKNLLIASGKSLFQEYSFYSFSGIKGQTKITKGGLQFTSRRVTIVLSSKSRDFVSHLVDLIFKESLLKIGGLSFVPEMAEEEISFEFVQATKYLCISPLILRHIDSDESDLKVFIDPSSDKFSDMLYENTIKRMIEYGFDPNKIQDAHKFQLIPDEDYLQRIKDSNKKFSRIYPFYEGEEKNEVRGYTFPFTLFAAPEVQEFVFTCGLGGYSFKGFGMLDLVNSDLSNRVIPFVSSENLISA